MLLASCALLGCVSGRSDGPLRHEPSGIAIPFEVSRFERGEVSSEESPDRIRARYTVRGRPEYALTLVLYDEPVSPDSAREQLKGAYDEMAPLLDGGARDPQSRTYQSQREYREIFRGMVELPPQVSLHPAHRGLHGFHLRSSQPTKLTREGQVYEYVMFVHGPAIVRVGLYRPADDDEALDEFLVALFAPRP